MTEQQPDEVWGCTRRGALTRQLLIPQHTGGRPSEKCTIRIWFSPLDRSTSRTFSRTTFSAAASMYGQRIRSMVFSHRALSHSPAVERGAYGSGRRFPIPKKLPKESLNHEREGMGYGQAVPQSI